MVGTDQRFGIAQVRVRELGALRAMGQTLFYPPNVKGWDGGSAWLNSQTMLTRENFANAVAQNPMMTQKSDWLVATLRTTDPRPSAATLTDALLQGHASPAARAQLIAYLSGAGPAAPSRLSGAHGGGRVAA